ncbi:hypothetical protein Tsubulata_024480 [Turnera subulata]|uniref:MRG domain-containing protein n=1 Tax=Turnera subulata TaxID=218843 RepID=A0A9Q0FN50_9ROSI|nr:hypothetical protein Tsubulata_024480 [Turnera subulata]
MGSSSKDDSGSDGDASSGDAPPSNSNLFSEGERVLAYHGPRIYEAKASLFLSLSLFLHVQKAELRKKEWRYFVHYLKSLQSLGHIANSWDEWVGADRLLKHTEENVMKQQVLEKKQGPDKNSKLGRSSQAKPKASSDSKADKEETKNAPKGKKRKSDSGTEKDNLALEKLVKIQIPPALKKQLVDDWEFVSQQDKLVKLPRSPNVDDILTKYLEFVSKKDGMCFSLEFEFPLTCQDASLVQPKDFAYIGNLFPPNLTFEWVAFSCILFLGYRMTDSIGEILKGIRCYFDKALPAMLLYKKERQQYQDIVKNDVSPSTIYGAEHLLRLFVKLPELLAYVNVEEETLTRLQQKLLDFLKFLQKNQSTFFLSSYDGSKVSEGKGKGKDQ